MKLPRRYIAFAASLVLYASFFVSLVHAADIEVGVDCNLADAITAANTDAAVGGCAAGSGADTITLTSDIALDAGLPRIASDLRIEGGGHTISGNGQFSIFLAVAGAFTLRDIALTEGLGLSGAGAIEGRGDAHILIENSSLVGNRTRGWGGAILLSNEAQLEMMNTTISGNRAYLGGGLALLNQSRATLTHVTIAKNRGHDAGGIYMHTHRVYLGDGKFLPDRAAVELRNSIVAANEGGDCFARLNQNFGNLIGDGTCIAARGGDPKLADLAHSPALHELLAGSRAIDSADADYCLPRDQRGSSRPQGGACDIGAFESHFIGSVQPTAEASVCTLADQIRAANTDAIQGECPAGRGHDTIRLTGDVVLNAALPPITSKVSIIGDGFTISGSKRHRIFNVQGGDLELSDLTLADSYSPTMGSAIYMLEGKLTMTNVEIVDSRADIEGALVNEFGNMRIEGSAFRNNMKTALVNGGDATILRSTFQHNSGFFGGAIQNRGRLDILACDFIENSAESAGAAVYNSGILSLIDSNIRGNAAFGYSLSVIYNNRGYLTISNNTLAENRAESADELIYNFLGDLVAADNAFIGNSPDVGWEGPPSD